LVPKSVTLNDPERRNNGVKPLPCVGPLFHRIR